MRLLGGQGAGLGRTGLRSCLGNSNNGIISPNPHHDGKQALFSITSVPMFPKLGKDPPSRKHKPGLSLALIYSPDCPGGGIPPRPRGSRTNTERTAALFPKHGSRAIGLGTVWWRKNKELKWCFSSFNITDYSSIHQFSLFSFQPWPAI